MKKAFIAYARVDKDIVGRLLTHLTGLKYANRLETWFDGEIPVGAPWEEQISQELNRSDMVILCVSADFLASEYVQTVEMPRAMERNQASQCRILPVILKPCAWKRHSFAHLQVTPDGGKPVTKYTDQEEAWTEVIQTIDKSIELAPGHSNSPPLTESAPVPEGAPAKRFHQAPSDRDIDTFILETIAGIRQYFQASIKNLEDANPGWEGKARITGDDAFEATIYDAHGQRRAHCGIFRTLSLGPRSYVIGYNESGVGDRNTSNDQLFLGHGSRGPTLDWHSPMDGISMQADKNMDITQACEHFWQRFTQHLK